MTKQDLLNQGFGGYIGWDEASALADYKATGGAGKYDASVSGGSSMGGGGNWQDILRQSQQMYQEAVKPQITALEAQKPQAETRYQQLLNDITRLTTKSTAQEFGKRGIPLDSTLYGQELAQATEPQIAQAGETRTNELNNIINTIASLQSGALTGGASQAMSLYNAQQQANQQTQQNALQQQQLAQQAQQNQYQTMGEGQTLYDTATGKPYYTAPKTYKSTDGGGSDNDYIINSAMSFLANSKYNKAQMWNYIHNFESIYPQVNMNQLWAIYNSLPQ